MTKLEALRDLLAEVESNNYVGLYEKSHSHTNFIAGFDACLNTVVKDLVDCLEDFKLGHVHNETYEHYRPMADTYGYCITCSEKVGLNQDDALDTLKKWDLSK